MATTSLKLRAKGLKLNTCQASFETGNVVITNNSSENSYTIANHPRYTDANEFSYSTQKKYDHIFFTNSTVPDVAGGDHSEAGEYYQIIQKANGKEQQDKYKVRLPANEDDMSFFGVYDGHSTHQIAELIANKLDDYIFENFSQNSDLKQSIKDAFEKLETEVINRLEAERPRGGSTVLCTIIQNKQIHVANLGDCQGIVTNGDKCTVLSQLHDFTNETEKQRVEQKGGVIFKNRLQGELAISRSIGDISYKNFMSSEPEISVYDIEEQDEYLILGTDGFWNGLSPENCTIKIQEFKKSENHLGDLKALTDFLIEEARGNIKTKKDNMTLIIVELGKIGKKKADKSKKFGGFF